MVYNAIGFRTSLKQCSSKTRGYSRRINILAVGCILVHVPDRNTRNRWFVASVSENISSRLFTSLSSGLLVNLSRPRCISNCWAKKFRFCKLFETHAWCTCYTNFIWPPFLKFSPSPPVFHAHILIFLHPPYIFSSPRDIFFIKIYIFFPPLYCITKRLY